MPGSASLLRACSGAACRHDPCGGGQVTKLLSSPLQRAMYTTKAVQTFQTLAGHKPPQACVSAGLNFCRSHGRNAADFFCGPSTLKVILK